MSVKAKIYRAFGVECTIQEIANAMCVTDQSVRNQVNKGTLEQWLASKGVYSSIELMEQLGKNNGDFEREYEERKSAELEALGFTPFVDRKTAKPDEINAIVEAITETSQPKRDDEQNAEPVINPFQEAESSARDTDYVPVQQEDADRDVSDHSLSVKLERYNAAIRALKDLAKVMDPKDDPELCTRITIMMVDIKDRRAYDYSYLIDWDDVARRLCGND